MITLCRATETEIVYKAVSDRRSGKFKSITFLKKIGVFAWVFAHHSPIQKFIFLVFGQRKRRVVKDFEPLGIVIVTRGRLVLVCCDLRTVAREVSRLQSSSSFGEYSKYSLGRVVIQKFFCFICVGRFQ